MFTADYELSNGIKNHVEDADLGNLYTKMQNEWKEYWIGNHGPQVIHLQVIDPKGEILVKR